MPLAEQEMTWVRLQQLAERTKKTFGPQVQLVEAMREHRFFERPVKIPLQYVSTTEKFLSPMPFDLVERVVADITDSPPIIEVPPLSDRTADLENSSKKEKWAAAMFRAMDKPLDTSAWEMGVDAACGDGKGILKLVYHPSRYAEKSGYPILDDFADESGQGGETAAELHKAAVVKFKRKTKIPVAWHTIDIADYRPIKGPEGEREAVIEIHRLDIEVLKDKYGLTVGLDGRFTKNADGIEVVAEQADYTDVGGGSGENESIEIFEYTDVKRWQMWGAGLKLDEGENPFGTLNYFEISGLQTSSKQPAHSSLSVIFPLHNTFDQINTEATKRTQISHAFGFPTFKRTGALIPTDLDEMADDEETGEVFEPGKIYDLELGGDIAPLIPPDIGALSDKYLLFLLSMMEQVGVSGITRGVGLGADASAALFSQIDAAARGIYQPIAKSAELALGGIVGALFHLVEHIGEPVVVRELNEKGVNTFFELEPADIDKYYESLVKLTPRRPSSLYSRGNFAAGMVKAGLMDRVTAMREYLDDQHPEETIQKIDFDRMRQTPAYQSEKYQFGLRRRLGVRQPEAPQQLGNAPNSGALPNTAGMSSDATAIR